MHCKGLLILLLALATTSESEAFVAGATRNEPHARSIVGSTCKLFGVTARNEKDGHSNKQAFGSLVTPEQQEQLDKYGATPETTFEIIFDKMTDTPDFVLNVLPKPWQKLARGLKDMKEKKKLTNTNAAMKKAASELEQEHGSETN